MWTNPLVAGSNAKISSASHPSTATRNPSPVEEKEAWKAGRIWDARVPSGRGLSSRSNLPSPDLPWKRHAASKPNTAEPWFFPQTSKTHVDCAIVSRRYMSDLGSIRIVSKRVERVHWAVHSASKDPGSPGFWASETVDSTGLARLLAGPTLQAIFTSARVNWTIGLGKKKLPRVQDGALFSLINFSLSPVLSRQTPSSLFRLICSFFFLHLF
ncbi:hypothetical protein B0T16DRAFT_166185 [Cercophora newfieldiana]|uniref:Uncharacterized protein n=1 Tax=Cercophora newfieldiana TaxID=92897 RepID=A0AA40CR97_9PEZI|nr:hypothetical protein B0T16DRAFT_166185 [Cercophora newfieldiana]